MPAGAPWEYFREGSGVPPPTGPWTQYQGQTAPQDATPRMDPDPGAAGYAMEGPSPVVRTPEPTGDGRTVVNNIRGHLDAALTLGTFGLYPYVQALFDDAFSDLNYSEALRNIPENIDETRADSPMTVGAVEGAGAMVPLLLTRGMAAPALTSSTATAPLLSRIAAVPFLPPAATSRLAQVGVQAGQGATLGAAGAAALGFNDELARTGDVNAAADRAGTDAIFGGVLGGAIPLAAAGAGAVGRGVRNLLPSRSAEREFTREVGDTASIASRMEADPRLTAADISPAAARFARTGAQQDAEIALPFVRRAEELGQARIQAVDDALGQVPNGQAYYTQLQEQARQVGREMIEPALANMRPVNLGGVLETIDQMLPMPGGPTPLPPGATNPTGPRAEALLMVRNMLAPGNAEMITDPRRLHEIQHELRLLAQDLGRSSDGMQRNLARDIQRIRQGVIDAMDAVSGGQYRNALSAYRDEMSVRDAFERGVNDVFYNPRRNVENVIEASPEAWNQWVAGLTPEELEAARLGARAALENLRQTARGSAAAGQALVRRLTENDKNRLRALFGADTVDNLLEQLALVDVMDTTGQSIIAASEIPLVATGPGAGRTIARGLGSLTSGGTTFAATGSPFMAGAAATGTALSDAAMRFASGARRSAINTRLANMATASGPAGQDTLRDLYVRASGPIAPLALAGAGAAPSMTRFTTGGGF